MSFKEKIKNVIPPDVDPEIFWSEDYTSDLKISQVKGIVLMSAFKAFPNHSKLLHDILKNNGIEDVSKDSWHSTYSWLSSLQEIEQRYSKDIVFEMGKKIIETVDLPNKASTLYDILVNANIIYHINYKNGRVGYIKLLDFSDKKKLAIIKCHTHSPTEYIRGAFYGVIDKYKPKDSFMISVKLIKSKNEPSKEDGGVSDYFRIKW